MTLTLPPDDVLLSVLTIGVALMLDINAFPPLPNLIVNLGTDLESWPLVDSGLKGVGVVSIFFFFLGYKNKH